MSLVFTNKQINVRGVEEKVLIGGGHLLDVSSLMARSQGRLDAGPCYHALIKAVE